MKMKKFIIIILYILLFSTKVISQEITPCVIYDNKNIGIQINYQEIFQEKNIKFYPRLGYTWHPLDPKYSNFFWQNIVEYKSFFIAPFWLRSYDKSVGYQFPSSIGYILYKKKYRVELWCNYVYHNNSFDFHMSLFPKKRWVLNYE